MNTKTKTFILFSVLICSTTSLFSDEIDEIDDKTKKTEYADAIRKNAGYTQIHTSGAKKISDESKKNIDTLLDTVIYNDISGKWSNHFSSQITQDSPSGAVGMIKISSPESERMKKEIAKEVAFNKEREKQELLLSSQKKEIPSYFVGGYCSVNTPVKIVRTSEFSTLNCTLDFGNGNFREASVFVGVYPNYKKETLTMLPIYASFSGENKASFDGIVFKGDKSSLNTADHVENYKIRKLVAEYGLAINDVAYRYSLDFMRVYQESKTQTNVEYVSVPDSNNPSGSSLVPIVTEETKTPKIEDYFALAGIELISKLFSIGAKNMLEDTEPLFRIFKGKRVYIEGVITIDNNGLSKKYGRIATETKKEIDLSNSRWESKNKELIESYDRSKQESVNFQRSTYQNSQNPSTIVPTTYGNGYTNGQNSALSGTTKK